MTLNLIKQIAVLGQRSLVGTISARVHTRDLFEPDYLETGKLKIPLVPTINIQIKGYDYSVLESYQALVHKLANIMQVDVDDSWALPPQEFKIQRYKTGTTAVVAEYNLKIYERNMQLSEVFSTKYSVLIRALEAALPQGITMNVDIYDPEKENKRYVPDKELIDLKEKLQTMKK